MPVLDQGRLAGILTESDLLHALVSGKCPDETIVGEVMVRKVSTVALHASSSELPRIFERGEVALVVDDDRKVLALLTKMDLIEMLARRKSA
jgi:cystathionine beta-synthase